MSGTSSVAYFYTPWKTLLPSPQVRELQGELRTAGRTCSICHHASTNSVIAKCNHIFCVACLNPKQCPICEKSFDIIPPAELPEIQQIARRILTSNPFTAEQRTDCFTLFHTIYAAICHSTCWQGPWKIQIDREYSKQVTVQVRNELEKRGFVCSAPSTRASSHIIVSIHTSIKSSDYPALLHPVDQTTPLTTYFSDFTAQNIYQSGLHHMEELGRHSSLTPNEQRRDQLLFVLKNMAPADLLLEKFKTQ